jgi:hypothetical protein
LSAFWIEPPLTLPSPLRGEGIEVFPSPLEEEREHRVDTTIGKVLAVR